MLNGVTMVVYIFFLEKMPAQIQYNIKAEVSDTTMLNRINTVGNQEHLLAKKNLQVNKEFYGYFSVFRGSRLVFNWYS